MKMTRRNFLSTSAVAALACGASLTAHAAYLRAAHKNSLIKIHFNGVFANLHRTFLSIFTFSMSKTHKSLTFRHFLCIL